MQLAGQVLIYPVTDSGLDTVSMRDNAEGYMLTAASMGWMWGMYVPDDAQRVEAYASARLAVIAMGKCGGHELNYVSDVDVIFVAEPHEGTPEHEAVKVGTMTAAQVQDIIGQIKAAQ